MAGTSPEPGRRGRAGACLEPGRAAPERHSEGVTTAGNLQGKAAVIAGSTTGIGFAAAMLFVEEGADVLITGRRQNELEEAAKAIGDSLAGVQGESKLADLDRLY
jgi:short chain dehydrogenase